jgi:hypothetical protein
MADGESIEADDRFPSGKWVGFFTDKRIPGKHGMELHLTFRAGAMTGTGRDRVAEFTVDGTYRTDDGSCDFRKIYPGSHFVLYRGFNEGRGIWGTWELQNMKGGFHIWPEGMPDPTLPALEEEAPLESEAPVEEGELLPVG